MEETQAQSLGWEDPLEGGMTTHSSILVGILEIAGNPMDRGAWLATVQEVVKVWTQLSGWAYLMPSWVVWGWFESWNVKLLRERFTFYSQTHDPDPLSVGSVYWQKGSQIGMRVLYQLPHYIFAVIWSSNPVVKLPFQFLLLLVWILSQDLCQLSVPSGNLTFSLSNLVQKNCLCL